MIFSMKVRLHCTFSQLQGRLGAFPEAGTRRTKAGSDPEMKSLLDHGALCRHVPHRHKTSWHVPAYNRQMQQLPQKLPCRSLQMFEEGCSSPALPDLSLQTFLPEASLQRELLLRACPTSSPREPGSCQLHAVKTHSASSQAWGKPLPCNPGLLPPQEPHGALCGTWTSRTPRRWGLHHPCRRTSGAPGGSRRPRLPLPPLAPDRSAA